VRPSQSAGAIPTVPADFPENNSLKATIDIPVKKRKALTRISHQLSTAAADPGMFTALRSVGLLDILMSMPAGPSVAPAGKLPDAPCIHARLHRLATKSGEECGLDIFFNSVRLIIRAEASYRPTTSLRRRSEGKAVQETWKNRSGFREPCSKSRSS
jgi:hypothetical protein